MGLSDGRKSFPIGLAVLIQYWSVTASHPATQPPSQPASHVAVAITLNALAKASSLISEQCHYLMDTNVTLITENHLIAVFTIGLQTQQHIHLQTKLFHDCIQTSYVDNAACSGITGR